MQSFNWDCEAFMLYPLHYQSKVPNKLESTSHTALIIANSDISATIEQAWDNSKVHICADGGANRLYNTVADKKRCIPNYIKGDLDSINPDVLQFYKDNGSTIIHEHDQDSTDLEKCLRLVESIESQNSTKFSTILVVGGLGGSFTHEIANCNVLYKHKSKHIVLWSENNAIWLLDKGFHEILVPAHTKCGVLPMGAKCSNITTTGLKWNLENGELDFGVLVSTSNVTIESRVTIQTSSPVLWSMDFVN